MVTEDAEFAAATRALDAVFIRYSGAREVDRLVAACYTDDALVLPPNLPLVQGRGQIRELLREMFEAGTDDVVRETTPLHVAGDLGYGVCRSTVATRRHGSELVRDTGKHLLIYRRQADGTWKIAADMFSSDLPSG